ncbi:hypothetical protein PR048_019260 [Dryococelus australis]|uniref:Uncharacterized protein n=1 Tax=Dryococelus australis TaxID=614101 RepID=A0ABQ9H324_9NEOP|nr:hypothetical protein PR048_019260 [Dryococelus australis]
MEQNWHPAQTPDVVRPTSCDFTQPPCWIQEVRGSMAGGWTKLPTRPALARSGSVHLVSHRRLGRGGGKLEIPEKTHRPAASSGTIPTCENPGATPPEIYHGSPWWEASSLTTTPSQPHRYTRLASSPPTKANRVQTSGRVTGISQVGIVPDDAVGRRVVSEISRFSPPLHSSAAPYSLQSLSPALKTSLVRAAQISSLTHLSPIRMKFCWASVIRCDHSEFCIEPASRRNILSSDPHDMDGLAYCEMNELPPSHKSTRTKGNSTLTRSSHDTPCSIFIPGATVAERLACSPPSKATRVQSPAGSLWISACGNRAGRCRWSAGFLWDLPSSPTLSFRRLYQSGWFPIGCRWLGSRLPGRALIGEWRTNVLLASDAILLACSDGVSSVR